MANCSFCGEQVIKSTGMIYVKKDGTIYSFCSGKCRKNLLKLKRSPFAVKWTQIHQKEKQTSKETGKRVIRRKSKTKKKKKKKKR